MLFRPPNRGRCKILLAVTASVSLAFLGVRAAEVDKLSPNEGSVSLGGRHLFGDTFNRERMAESILDPINPVGGWPKDPKQRSVGQYTQAAFEQDAQGTVLHMAIALGWTEEEVTVFISHFRREIRSPKIHSYFRQKVVWGRKPL
ncbi:unnamed protein product [Fusarium venenatum]|uniref:Uncharacterized protein n=1 Tax=Fusarium venenatum TaxID=56646 RepID=A0A2L2TJ32_9HYPO|nr:uncharacterized protein FVRRES_11051 [Fusarium venenatum]CEI70974.1 unnamed protein product [Fusarium venenatum]